MNLIIIMKNHAADPEIGFLTKSISKPYDHAMAMSTTWELSELKSDMVSKMIKFQGQDECFRVVTGR